MTVYTTLGIFSYRQLIISEDHGACDRKKQDRVWQTGERDSVKNVVVSKWKTGNGNGIMSTDICSEFIRVRREINDLDTTADY